jgi:hypothetical protein
LPLSVVGWPIEGAGDAPKMGASAFFDECYLPRVRARSRHHRPPKAVAASFELWAIGASICPAKGDVILTVHRGKIRSFDRGILRTPGRQSEVDIRKACP